MKRIPIYSVAALLAALFLAGCMDDKGNYTYRDPAVVTPTILSELEPSYNIIMLTNFELDPEIEGNEADYDYFWYTYPNGTTTQNRRDTIGIEKKLDYTVTLAPGRYNLVFEAKDRQTGVSAFRKTIISVSSFFGTGYYINKYENGQTDIDFIDADGKVNQDILKTINGESLAGRPVRSTLSDRYCYPTINADGSATMNNWVYMIMVCSDEDMRIYRGDDMTEVYDWDNAFMETPAVKKPQGVWGTRGGFMVLNDGKLHTVGGATYSDGRFGYAYPEEGLKLSGRGCAVASCLMLFDENAGQIVGYHNTQNRYAYIDPYPQTVQHHFTNQELLCAEMQYNYVGSTSHAFALLRSKNEGEVGKLRFVDVMAGSFNTVQQVPYYGSYEVPAEASNVGNGKIFCMQNGTGSGGGASVLYYTTGDNSVHYYNYNNQTHKSDVVTIPADEQIAYIYHNCDWAINGGSPAIAAQYPDGLNSFLVLSNKAGNWTLRVYDMLGATPDVDKDAGPRETYTGTGEAASLFYRIPLTNATW